MNCAMSYRRKKRPLLDADLAEHRRGDETLDPGERPVDQLSRAETRAQITAAIEKLDERNRAVLVLRDIEGLDYNTISEVLGMHVGTVRSRLHRARLQLRGLLADVD
jgi:RNA polymerase sigma-70 factor, ECF subfamily